MITYPTLIKCLNVIFKNCTCIYVHEYMYMRKVHNYMYTYMYMCCTNPRFNPDNPRLIEVASRGRSWIEGPFSSLMISDGSWRLWSLSGGDFLSFFKRSSALDIYCFKAFFRFSLKPLPQAYNKDYTCMYAWCKRKKTSTYS